jgi:two-component system, NarL family, invasion response regulator UvrY
MFFGRDNIGISVMIKIIIADDHAIVRKGLKQILEDTMEMIVADEAESGFELMDKLHKSNAGFDIVILDITMPGKSGLDVLKEIKAEWPELPVLVLSVHQEEQYALRVLKAGAAGYINKKSAPEDLIEAIRIVSTGRKYISHSIAETLILNLDSKKEKPLHELLSDREYQVFCMIASGKAVGTISKDLNLSVKTISTYRSHILKKMNFKDNAELTHYAIKNQIVE